MPYNSQTQRKNIILNMINHLGPISRTALIDLAAIRPATIGSIVSELMAEQLVVETESISVGHGRKRVLLDINKEHVCAISVSFSQSNATYILSQFDGQILQKKRIPFNTAKPDDQDLELLKSCICELLEQYKGRNIVGIGLCKFLFSPMQTTRYLDSWMESRLKPCLTELTQIPVKIFSEVTLPAVAEHRFGVAKGVDNFLWIEMSNGIGASLFCNGMAISGAHGVAGELGHTIVDRHNEDKPLCNCGKAGCIESSASVPALMAKVREAMKSGVTTVLNAYELAPEELTINDVRRALDDGDYMCRHYVKDIAAKIGIAVSNAVNLMNPELIVVHGDLVRLGKHFLTPFEEAIRDNVVYYSNNFEIRVSNSFEDPMLMGAVAEMFSAYLHVDDFRWIYQLSFDEQE